MLRTTRMARPLKSHQITKTTILIMKGIRNLVGLYSRRIKSRMKVSSKNQITRRSLLSTSAAKTRRSSFYRRS
jgi:hypothetical protein